MEIDTDVVVLGAGAAGLAAAGIISHGGADVVVLEARDRIGGRLLTREDPGLPVPLELGAEFIHGTPESTFALLRAANTVALDTAGRSLRCEHGTLRDRDDPFEIVARVMQRAKGLREDVSVTEFTRDFPDVERRYARLMVEGFDAADPSRASARAIAEEWSGGPGGQTSRQFRPLGGYAVVVRALHAALDPQRVRVLLETPATVLRRAAHGVEAVAASRVAGTIVVRARAAIVTLPLGVLQSGDLRFEPVLPGAKRTALEQLVMGPVVKLVLRFRTAFWEELDGARLADAAFFHLPEASFPTFWAMLPLRVPLLTAWAGGPYADRLAADGEATRVRRALDDLRAIFGEGADPHGSFEAAYTHDWQRDRFAYGAYSYVAVGGAGARAALAAPLDGATFFAGEATASVSEAGTVAGALQTGERAGREALEAIAAARGSSPVGA